MDQDGKNVEVFDLVDDALNKTGNLNTGNVQQVNSINNTPQMVNTQLQNNTNVQPVLQPVNMVQPQAVNINPNMVNSQTVSMGQPQMVNSNVIQPVVQPQMVNSNVIQPAVQPQMVNSNVIQPAVQPVNIQQAQMANVNQTMQNNVILDNSMMNPVELSNLGVSTNIDSGINALNQTENILSESIHQNLGTDEDLRNFNNVAATIQEEKNLADTGAAETERWLKESKEKELQEEAIFNPTINPTLNNIKEKVNFDNKAELQVPIEETKVEQEPEIVDNKDKNKKGIGFIIVLFIILFIFVFSLPYISNYIK